MFFNIYISIYSLTQMFIIHFYSEVLKSNYSEILHLEQ